VVIFCVVVEEVGVGVEVVVEVKTVVVDEVVGVVEDEIVDKVMDVVVVMDVVEGKDVLVDVLVDM
jgi:hypothetical protein